MSFAKGFGSTFGPSYNAAADRRHQTERDEANREDDMFKMKFQVHLQKREAYEERKRQDAKYVNQARRVANELGVDPKAVPTIAQSLADGNDEKYVKESFANGKWDFSKVKELNTQPAIDTQTEQALGQAGPQAPQETKPAERKKAGWLDKILNPGKLETPKKTVDQRIAETAGVPEAELYQSAPTTTGYEDNGGVFTANPVQAEIPSANDAGVALERAGAALDADPSNPDLQAAYQQAKIDYDGTQRAGYDDAVNKALAAGLPDPRLGMTAKIRDRETGKLIQTLRVRQDPKNRDQMINMDTGQPLSPAEQQAIEPIGKEEIQAQTDAQKHLSGKKEFNAFNTASNSLTSMTEDLAVLDTLAKDNERILEDGYITMASLADSSIRNANAFYEGASNALETFTGTQGEEGIPESLRAEAEGIVEQWGQTAPSSDVDAAVLFKARALLAGYKLGKTLGQTGNALAEKERVALMGAVAAGHDIRTFRQNAGNIITSLEGDVDRAGETVYSDPVITGFEDQYGYPPVETAGKWREVNKDNPKVQHMLQVTEEAANGPARPEPQAGETTPPATEPAGDPEFDTSLRNSLKGLSREEYTVQVKELRAEYDAEHGAGMFDKNVLLKR